LRWPGVYRAGGASGSAHHEEENDRQSLLTSAKDSRPTPDQFRTLHNCLPVAGGLRRVRWTGAHFASHIYSRPRDLPMFRPTPDRASARPYADAPPEPGRGSDGSSDVSRLLDAAAAGERQAADALLPLVYDELRKLAAARMAAERPDHTLNATALVHEAYLRLVGDQRFDHRGHFFAAAAKAMRRILVEAARKKGRLKRGGGKARVPLNGLAAGDPEAADDLLALDHALGRLEAERPQAARVVELRYFAGLSIEQAATALDVSVQTANRLWKFAKARLYQQLGGADDVGGK
jgi:RNA polymerase sigma factor (TIGR02999 family)